MPSLTGAISCPSNLPRIIKPYSMETRDPTQAEWEPIAIRGFWTKAETDRILETIIRPTVAATRFTGFLYAGLMMTANGPKILEYNVRLGDPETQPILYRLQSDLAEVLLAAAEGNLHNTTLQWSQEPAVSIVLASGGYPGPFDTGLQISGIAEAETSAVVFHAGTKLREGKIETSGGRVLGVTAGGPDLASAINRAYEAAGRIHFDRMHYRRDIGAKGLKGRRAATGQ